MRHTECLQNDISQCENIRAGNCQILALEMSCRRGHLFCEQQKEKMDFCSQFYDLVKNQISFINISLGEGTQT